MKENLHKFNKINKITAIILVLAFLYSAFGCTALKEDKAKPEVKPDEKLISCINYLYSIDKKPTDYRSEYDWNVMLLSYKQSEFENIYAEYCNNHIENLKEHLAENEGKIDDDRPTNYAKTAIMLKQAGYDPTDFYGYNLLLPLDDDEEVVQQGLNAETYALIASNYCGYKLENEELYYYDLLNHITDREDYEEDEIIDYEAMAIYALSYYTYMPDTLVGIDIAFERMADVQEDDGSFSNAESTAQLIIALSSLGIDVTEYELFIKDGNSLMDGLLGYSYEDGFMHVKSKEKIDGIATQQGALALVSQENLSQNGLFPKADETMVQSDTAYTESP